MSAATMSGDPTPIIAVLDIQATYSAREAAVLLGEVVFLARPEVASRPVHSA
jgi:hypothetical protein